jgi:hypothetical protein
LHQPIKHLVIKYGPPLLVKSWRPWLGRHPARIVFQLTEALTHIDGGALVVGAYRTTSQHHYARKQARKHAKPHEPTCLLNKTQHPTLPEEVKARKARIETEYPAALLEA